ncbi:hypothetical protein C7271_16070 [filamentous cyanobacterium CCP5]|nr:hypothetical protein C7271_16070 [filamentous cyanobacterium CCP5]
MSWLDRGLLGLSRGRQLWLLLLARVRSRLPKTWQGRLNDTLLSAIALGLLALLLIVISPGGEPAPAAPTPTAEQTEPVVADPEPQAIADLQAQASEITAAYAAGMVQSVQADFRQGRLTIVLGAQWYGLAPSQQDQLAQDLYGRLESLEFAHLYLQDPEDHAIARNPVIGDRMVILQRQSPDVPIL